MGGSEAFAEGFEDDISLAAEVERVAARGAAGDTFDAGG
jgi:hypothetical protein